MMIVRFLGVAFAFVLTFVIAKLTNIPVLEMMGMMSFILIIDSLVLKFIVRQYMLGIAAELQDPRRRDDERNKE